MLKNASLTMFLVFILNAGFALQSVSAHEEKLDNSWWWSNSWWNKGKLPTPKNYELEVKWSSYDSNGVDVPVMVARPKKKGKFPAVFFQHGRRGLDDLIQRHAKRIAAQGFVVLAPDIYKAHFMGTHPVEHDYELEKDVNAGLSVLLSRKDISTNKACFVLTYSWRLLHIKKLPRQFKRQQKDVACYVSYYPHLQDPNAPEASQVYGYAPEVDQMKIPMLVFYWR